MTQSASKYPWWIPQFYNNSLQTFFNRSYNSLEWVFSSPPKPHAFVSLPLQSSVFEILVQVVEACDQAIYNHNWARDALHTFDLHMANWDTGESTWLSCGLYENMIDRFDSEGLVYNQDLTVSVNLDMYKLIQETRYENLIAKAQVDIGKLNESIPQGPRLGQTGILSYVRPFPRQ